MKQTVDRHTLSLTRSSPMLSSLTQLLVDQVHFLTHSTLSPIAKEATTELGAKKLHLLVGM